MTGYNGVNGITFSPRADPWLPYLILIWNILRRHEINPFALHQCHLSLDTHTSPKQLTPFTTNSYTLTCCIIPRWRVTQSKDSRVPCLRQPHQVPFPSANILQIYILTLYRKEAMAGTQIEGALLITGV